MEILIAQLLPPEGFRGSGIGRARSFLAIVGKFFVTGEIEFFVFQQIGGEGDPLFEPLQVAFENDVGEAGVAVRPSHIGEFGPGFGELVDVALQENQVGQVEGVEVAVEKFPGQCLVELLVGEL